MSANTAQHPDAHVFSYCGYVDGDSPTDLKAGYAVAVSPEEAIRVLHECGFHVTAITSLSEIRMTIQILQMIACKHPDVEQSEYLDLYAQDSQESGQTPYPEDKVFCFSGHVVDSAGVLRSGFIAASSVQFVIDYLQGFGFIVETALSLSDLRQTMDEMSKIAAQDPSIDLTTCLNLKD